MRYRLVTDSPNSHQGIDLSRRGVTYDSKHPLVAAVLCQYKFATGVKWTVPKISHTEKEANEYKDFLRSKSFVAVVVPVVPA